MIKPGYYLAVVAPPRGTLTNQGLVSPSRETKNNQGLVAPLTPTPTPIYFFNSPSTPTSQRLEDGDPPYNLIPDDNVCYSNSCYGNGHYGDVCYGNGCYVNV